MLLLRLTEKNCFVACPSQSVACERVHVGEHISALGGAASTKSSGEAHITHIEAKHTSHTLKRSTHLAHQEYQSRHSSFVCYDICGNSRAFIAYFSDTWIYNLCDASTNDSGQFDNLTGQAHEKLTSIC